MDNLEPITREEMLIDGQDLEPITRKEMFIKRIYDKTQVVPKPITREEMFLNKAGEGGGGDITIEQLNVTQNGTYSESGKAYSPVVVNVPTPPIPENAYLLNDLSGLPADIASFTDGTDLPMASLKVAVTPYQDLHGYDGPWAGGAGKNKIPYPYYDEASKTVNGVTFTVSSDGTVTANGTATTNAEYRLINNSIQLPSGSYTLSGVPSGASESTFVYNTYAGSSVSSAANLWDSRIRRDTTFTANQDIGYLYIGIRIISGYTANNLVFKPMFESGSSASPYAPYSNICPIIGWDEAVVTVADDVDNPTVEHEYTIDLNGTRYGGTLDATDGTFLDMIDHIASYNGEELPSAWISDRDVYTVGTTPTIGAEVVYPRATPITVQLSPTQVKSLEGTNNIFADCGDIIKLEYFSKEV